MAPAPIRVGLIGYGLAGSVFHAPLIVSTPALRLAAIVTGDSDRRAKAAHDHPSARIVESADRLWDDARDLDFVVVATPNRTHVPLARAALDAGLPVVVDKPFAPTAAEGRALIAHASERNLLLTVFQNRRWDSDFLTVRQLASDGSLGTVFRLDSRFDRWRPIPKGGWRERGDPAEAGGLLYDLGSHLIDQALLLLGPVSDVYAELDRRAGRPVDDDAFVALAHASGARSHLTMTVVAAQPGPRFHIMGSRAAYLKFGSDVQEDALKRGEQPTRPGWGEEPPERWGTLGVADDRQSVRTVPGSYQDFYTGVAAALRESTAPPVDPNDSVAGLEIIEAAQQSAAGRQVVSIRRGS
ncbi:MAG TPA: Gfo/Idh/MocA family oxidoreductase [Gemmatimonadaceae bacterium]|jgi:predicted dehydrogenase